MVALAQKMQNVDLDADFSHRLIISYEFFLPIVF